MSPRIFAPIALLVDRLLRPLGLIMWAHYSYDDGPGGVPMNMRVTGISFGRRPNLDRAVWEAKRQTTPAEREGLRIAEQRPPLSDTLLMIGLVLLVVLLGTVLAHARYSGPITDPATASWFKNQHNEQGQWCCDESDGHPFFGAYTLNDDGSVTIEHEGRTHKLPAYMVLKGGNPTGHAVWWFTDAGGEHRDYCFALGTLS